MIIPHPARPISAHAFSPSAFSSAHTFLTLALLPKCGGREGGEPVRIGTSSLRW